MCIICIVLFIINLLPENERIKLCFTDEEYNRFLNSYIIKKITWKNNKSKL